MNFELKYYVKVEEDVNLFSREDFERLSQQLEKTKDGLHKCRILLTKSKLKNLDLSGLNLSNIDFSDAYLKNINFEGAQMAYTSFENSKLIDCNFTKTQLKKSNLYKLRATGCNFNQTNLASSQLKWLVFDDCYIEKMNIERSLFTGCDLSKSKVVSFFASGAEMSSLQLPDGVAFLATVTKF